MIPDEIGDRALKDHAEPFGIDAPSHDVERIGPQLLARRLDPRGAAVACAQHDGGRAVAEKAGGNHVGLGQIVMPDRQCAEFERDQQHVAAGSRLCEP